ncbi:hypothetical protein HW932_16840 [Allochromatium humboldtianum]|uniref:Uncharacterized protein n=1 Tax=Allochromatium humboldtianum TaxID=504901 RepID=A0A850RJ81_9GAMM|nr:hypothetical protein [Allochromatium humboldtianum]NVZ10930.1 hypothetical protein [Allochromatium humboldtianum]
MGHCTRRVDEPVTDARIEYKRQLGGEPCLNAAWICLKPHLCAGDQRAGECGNLEAGDPAQSGIGGVARRSRRIERLPVIQSIVGADTQTDQRATAGELRPLGGVPPPAQGDIETMAIQRLVGVGCKWNQTARIDELTAIHGRPCVRIDPSRRQAP